ncbi:methyltransferase domain-containing protein [Aureimonas fodinaquatilis]|uniref:Methyltransferase domain-containing protein n=1 Tax=Aureimonas fodinaquatilis TaxID=2565783 RepID=A0A5B0DX59_9HYPH|nr:class I SAM-dependent methyltransferase [Aureimonas fodinaquatilis]KAA0970351.1 methyltransferase domain-containing protein [Aureimonas fodinaquatilis]
MPTSDAENVIKLYQEHAASFEEQRGRDLFERNWLDAFVRTMPPAGVDVLDVGCGNGMPLAGYLIEQGCRITGVDGAAEMIDRATVNFPDQSWLVADMRKLPEMKRFHGIIAWHSFFHLTFEDQRQMFATFDRLSAAGAALMFTSGPAHGEAIGTFEGQPLYHSSLDSSEYRDLLQAYGFTVVDHVKEDPSCGGATVWLARKA